MAMNGAVVMLEINVGTPSVPDYELIPCQASFDLAGSANVIDTSCKDTAPAGTNIPGRLTWTLSVEYNPDSFPEIPVSPTTVQDVLFKAFNTGLQVGGQIAVSGAGEFTFLASIASYSIGAPDQERVSIAIELAISGGLVAVTP